MEIKETEQVKAMRRLGFTDEEITNVLKSDYEIDHGAKPFELTPEQEKASREARMTKQRAYTFTPRERKANNEKAGLIELFAAVLKEQPACGNLDITNPEREINFVWDGTKYRIVLSAPRK